MNILLNSEIVTGKKIVLARITFEEFEKMLEGFGMPRHGALDLSAAFQFADEFGCRSVSNRLCAENSLRFVDYGGKPSSTREGLARRPSTYLEFVKKTDWRKVFV